ncbi:VOC family protein [Shewanella maritima]|uniref:VOC family protein n=1 Tax=Shewanella maritima TaxID=2520507 RepID=UPI003736DA3D
MRLEHLNIVVKELKPTINFYQAAFPHWKIRGGGVGEWHGVWRRWVHFGDDYTYLSLNDNGKNQNRDNKGYDVGLSHLAFVVDDIQSLMVRMQQAGYPIAIDGKGDPSYKSVYYLDPDGYEVEFLQYFTDIPDERNEYEPFDETLFSDIITQ